jgi:V/A-type H+-transporting ATPase subunit I
MFGMMFGDVGHGGIFLLLGLLLRLWPHLRAGFKNTGTILIGVGTSSMVFGAFYGSVFGYENILPAIWFRPMDDINRLLLYAIILGAGVIIVGISVNIAVKLVQHRYLDLSYERFGLLGLWFYLGAVGMVINVMKGGSLNIPVVFVSTFLPLLLMPIVKMITRRWRKEGEEEESGFTGLIVAGVDLFEGMLVYLSNSISFVRVAAFALNHVALSLAIFQLGRMLESMVGGGGMLYIITVAGGNLLILVLEGGIVGIQTLRLEFYEFFSKFFDEEGTAFVPFAYKFERNRR